MAVLFIDGFDHYRLDSLTDKGQSAVNDMQLKGWDPGNSFSHVRIGPLFARGETGLGLANSNTGAYVFKPVPAGRSFVVGMAMRWPAVPNNVLFGLKTSGGSEIVDVRGDGAGHLKVTRANTTLATSANTVSAGVWYYVELKVVINSSTGSYELRVDGTSVGWVPAATGANTGNADAERFTLYGGYTNTWMDDLYIANQTAPNDDFLGPCKVATLRPVAAGTNTDWSGNGGTNFANAGQFLPDGDTTFNESATADDLDSFVFDDLPAAAGSIYAVQHNILTKKDAGAARSIAPLQRTAGTDYAGTTAALTTSYAYVVETLNVNPEDSAAWAVADVNGSEFGYKLVS